MEGLIYEPRSLWSIARVASSSEKQLVRLDRRHFYNGGRWPIQIRRMALMAVNYVLADNPTSILPLGPDETSQIIQKTRVAVSVPQRYHLNAKRSVLSGGAGASPTGQPPAEPVDLGDANIFTPSSLYGLSMLKLDKPMIIPRNGTIEWGLSAHSPWAITGGGSSAENVATRAWMLFQETGGLFAGSARARVVNLAAFTGNNTPTVESWPYGVDDFGAGIPTAAANPSNNWWPPQSFFPAAGGAPDANGQRNTTFAAQESTRAGSTEIGDMRCYIEQLDYDHNMDDDGGYADLRAAQLATRTGCRIRSVNGGSKTWWWRPGAPLGLVFDHISPANVYQMPKEITLGPGEQLEVEMVFPAQTSDPTNYQIGISFNGFAAIQG